MGDTRFYVELPADEYGSTSQHKAVVEARRAVINGSEMLIPIAPPRHASRWPDGWPIDLYGGWVEVKGPARELSFDEWETLIDSIR
jgi:hypothetical protein